jgi:integrase
MQRLAEVPTLTRADLERAAVAFFEELSDEIDQPRQFDPERFDQEVVFNVDASRSRAGELADQLKENLFDQKVQTAAHQIASRAGASLHGLPERQRLIASQLAARAEKVQMDLLVHMLEHPAVPFEPEDRLFSAPIDSPAQAPVIMPMSAERPTGPRLSEVVVQHVHRKKARGLSQSQIDEVTRALLWLQERFGRDRDITSIEKRELATFRDDLGRLDVTLRGRGANFEDRLTNNPAEQIKSVTALRYWRSIQAFFAWAAAEGFAGQDPSSGLMMELRKGEVKRSPEPFSTKEIRQFLETPLYAGYESPKRLLKPGHCRRRTGQWWAGVLMMFTGLRAGELSQLLPTDFNFAADVPHLRVQEEDEKGEKVKSAKTASSVRDVPLSPVILALGLRHFVEGRAKLHPNERVFREFRLGTRGRVSDGMSKFWSRYLKAFGLWKPGRATHVWRHTVIALLRANDVSVEDIAALVGHSGGTVTSRYGGEYPLVRRAKTLARLDFGFDVLSALGGPFDGKRHG